MRNEKCNESQPMLLPFSAACREGLPAPGEATSMLTCQLPEHPFPIAGFRYYAGAASIPALTPGTRLTLRAEPANPHDAFAIEILYGPAKLGYVPRFCNRHVNRLLLNAVPLACDIERFDPQAPPWEAVSVRVHMLRPLKTASLFCCLAFLWPYWTTAINSPLKLSKHGADRPTVGPQRQRFMQERWLSVGESAAHQGVNADATCKWIDRKIMPARKIGRLWKFLASEVDARVKGGKAAQEKAQE